MDLEILELVNLALDHISNGDVKTAEAVLQDITCIYAERMEAEADASQSADEREAITLNHIFGGDPVAQLSDIIARTTGKE